MLITIRDKHTGVESDIKNLLELISTSLGIYMVNDSSDGYKTFFYNNKDYEIVYVGDFGTVPLD